MRYMLPNILFESCTFACGCSDSTRPQKRSIGRSSIAGELLLHYFPDSSNHHSFLFIAVISLVVFTAFALPLVIIVVIRTELLHHYNQREPVWLKLDSILTFVLSYVYFQHHLFDIAKRKWHPLSAPAAGNAYTSHS